jgi:hypothetical protein
VGGACISAIKFFFDGNQPIRPLLLAPGSDVVVPTSDGLGSRLTRDPTATA